MAPLIRAEDGLLHVSTKADTGCPARVRTSATEAAARIYALL